MTKQNKFQKNYKDRLGGLKIRILDLFRASYFEFDL